jgi:hypothetical protein
LNFKVNYDALAAAYVYAYKSAETEEEKERILLDIANEDLAVIEELVKGFKRD